MQKQVYTHKGKDSLLYLLYIFDSLLYMGRIWHNYQIPVPIVVLELL